MQDSLPHVLTIQYALHIARGSPNVCRFRNAWYTLYIPLHTRSFLWAATDKNRQLASYKDGQQTPDISAHLENRESDFASVWHWGGEWFGSTTLRASKGWWSRQFLAGTNGQAKRLPGRTLRSRPLRDAGISDHSPQRRRLDGHDRKSTDRNSGGGGTAQRHLSPCTSCWRQQASSARAAIPAGQHVSRWARYPLPTHTHLTPQDPV